MAQEARGRAFDDLAGKPGELLSVVGIIGTGGEGHAGYYCRSVANTKAAPNSKAHGSNNSRVAGRT
jgi:hypothetical protein